MTDQQKYYLAILTALGAIIGNVAPTTRRVLRDSGSDGRHDG